MSLCPLHPLAGAALADGFCAGVVPLSASQPRSIQALDHPTDFLFLERGASSVVIGEDSDGDGIPDSKRVLATG